MAIYTQKPITRHSVRRTFTVIIRKTIYHWNSVYPSIWNKVSYDFLLFMLKLKPRPEEQTPCHSHFPARIIRGPHRGSIAALYITTKNRNLQKICNSAKLTLLLSN